MIPHQEEAREDEKFLPEPSLKAAEDEETSSKSIEEVVTLSSKLCMARIQLLCLKAQYISDPIQQEVILKEGIDLYINFVSSVEAYESVAVQSIIEIKEIKLRTFVESIKLFKKLIEFYNSRAQHEEALFQVRFTRLHKRKTVEDLVFIYRTLFPSHPRYASIKKAILDYTSEDFDTCLGEISNTQPKLREQILTLLGEARAYVHRYKSITNDEKDSRYKEMKSLLERITTPAGISREELGRLFFKNTEGASILTLHYNLMKTINTNKKRRSQGDFQEALGAIYEFQNNLLKRELIFPLSEDNIFEFYDSYFTGIMSSIAELHNATLNFSVIFMSLGKYQEAADHVHAFKANQRERNPERPFADLDLVEAISLAFLGNPEKIMELERVHIFKEIQEEENKLKEKERNKEALQRKVAQLQAAAEELEQANRKLKESQLASQVAAEARKKAATSFPGARSAQEMTEEAGEEKEAKLERHIKHEEERKRAAEQASSRKAVDEMESASPSAASEPLPVRAIEETSFEETSFIPFDENVRLTKLQKRVEKEIREGTWNITPDQLRQYYETFGCSTRQRGSHTVASLPSYNLVFLPNDELLTVNFALNPITFSGGDSFTFAKWEDTVPFYLQKQILRARLKIQDFLRITHQSAQPQEAT